MAVYDIREYQRGYERDQARIGIQVALSWLWPLAYDEDDGLILIHNSV